MKTIALISGGKDSLLAILAAYRYGHEPVVLVHLTPRSAQAPTSANAVEQELDSYMFQTVGSNVVQDIAHCMGLPLRLGYIEKGQSKDVSLAYSTTPDQADEVEVLFRLLQAVKEEFPEVKGVTTGAILSNYQRLRVEAVCFRLGLMSLSYLWMRKPAEILDMAKALRVKAILVKTASIGLDPRILIGRTLEEVRPQLELMADQYGSHLAGEGGEYETIVLDFPMFSTTYLEVVAKEIVVVDDNPFAPSGHGILTVARRPKGRREQEDDAVVLKQLVQQEIQFASDVMPSLLLSSTLPCSSACAAERQSLASHIGSCTLQQIGSTLGLMEFVTQGNDGTAVTTTTTATTIVATLLGRWEKFADSEAVKPYFFLFVASTHGECEAFDRAYESTVSWVDPPGRLTAVSNGGDSSNGSAHLHVYYYYGQDKKKREKTGECCATATATVLHCQSRSHWAAGALGPVAQGTRLHRNSDSFCFIGPVFGLVPALGELAVQKTFETIPSPHVHPQSDFEAEACFAFANLIAYLDFFKLVPASVTHLTCVVTSAACNSQDLQDGSCSVFFSLFQHATLLFVNNVSHLPSGAQVAFLVKSEA